MENNSEISVRISKLIDFLSVKPNSFALKLGYDRAQTVYDIVKGKSAPSYDFFKRLMNSEYSDNVSIKWLLTGKGNIVEESGTQQKGTTCEKCKLKDQMIDNLNREVATQAEFIKYMQEKTSPVEDGQKRKESPDDYGNSKLSEAV